MYRGKVMSLLFNMLSRLVTAFLSRSKMLVNGIIKNNTSKWWFFFIFHQLMKHPLIKLFHLSNLLQMSNNHRIVYTEFFGSFSCSWKGINFNDCSQLVIVNFSWSCSLSSRLSSPWTRVVQNFSNHHCAVCSLAVPGPNALLMLQVVSTALLSLWTQIIKSLKLAFCLTSFS